MSDDLARWRRAALVGAALVVGSCPLYLVRESLRAPGARAPAVAEAAFVGRAACARCHEKATLAWTGSHHDQAMTEATEATVRGDFSGVAFEGDGMKARFFRDGGKFLIETEGPDGKATAFEVAYTFGWDPLQQYLIRFPGGRMQAFSVAWDVPGKKWFFLYPGKRIPRSDWLHWTRNAQNWNGMCAECHSTNLVKGFDPKTDSYKTTWSELDVSCEACHGPGSRHVAWAEVPPMGRARLDNAGLVMKTSGISNRELVELCAPCHSRRTELGDYDHRRSELLDNQLPVLLSEGLYHPDGQIQDEVFEYGSFVQSKMFRMGVRCTDCHDAHTLKLRKEGNGVCLQCHSAPAYDDARHHFHKKEWKGRPSEGALCAACHMPKSPFMVVHMRADHSIRVPRPDLTKDIGVPNACSGCHKDKPLVVGRQRLRQVVRHGQEAALRQRARSGPSRRPGRESRPAEACGRSAFPDARPGHGALAAGRLPRSRRDLRLPARPARRGAAHPAGPPSRRPRSRTRPSACPGSRRCSPTRSARFVSKRPPSSPAARRRCCGRTSRRPWPRRSPTT